LARTIRISDDPIDGLNCPLHVRRITGKPPLARVTTADHAGEGLIDLMGNRRRKLAERCDAGETRQIRTGLLQSFVSHLPHFCRQPGNNDRRRQERHDRDEINRFRDLNAEDRLGKKVVEAKDGREGEYDGHREIAQQRH
jgi:hypothetical protein